MFNRKKKDGFAIIKPAQEGVDLAGLSIYLRDILGESSVKITHKTGDTKTIESLSLPRRIFREKLGGSSELRRAIRGSDVTIQDISEKPLRIGKALDAPIYVKEAKALGAEGVPSKTIKDSENSLRDLTATLEEWGQVKIPVAILLLILGGTLYGAYRLFRVTENMAKDYAEALNDASSSDAGLEKALRARSGSAGESHASADTSTATALPAAENKEAPAAADPQ